MRNSTIKFSYRSFFRWKTFVAVWEPLTYRLLLSLWHKLLPAHQTWVWSKQNYFHQPFLERHLNFKRFILCPFFKTSNGPTLQRHVRIFIWKHITQSVSNHTSMSLHDVKHFPMSIWFDCPRGSSQLWITNWGMGLLILWCTRCASSWLVYS